MPKPLKPYWFRPGVTSGRLIPDLNDRYDKNSHLRIEPSLYKWDYPGACLFSRMEMKSGLVKCWLYNFKTSENLRDPKDRDYFVYWVDPAVLVELSMEE